MSSRNLNRTTAEFAKQSASYAGRIAEKSAVGLAHWATTDHTGTVKFVANMPAMGFIDTIRTLLMTLVISILSAVLASFLFFLLIAFGIPLLLSL